MTRRRQAAQVIQSDHSWIGRGAGQGIGLKEAADTSVIRPGPVMVESALGIELPPRESR